VAGSQGNMLVNDFKPYHLSLTPIMETARARYSGLSRKLIVALDIGTTFSGAAYALLDPGEVPKIQSVTRQVFPPTHGPGANGDGEIGIKTLRTMGLQKFPPYYITTATEISVALRTGLIFRMTTRF